MIFEPSEFDNQKKVKTIRFDVTNKARSSMNSLIDTMCV